MPRDRTGRIARVEQRVGNGPTHEGYVVIDGIRHSLIGWVHTSERGSYLSLQVRGWRRLDLDNKSQEKP